MGQDLSDLTTLLERANCGDAEAHGALMNRVYDDLRRVAGHQMQRILGAGGHHTTLQPTVLVNETYLRLIKQRQRFDNRGQFFALATKLMIRVLLDHRRRSAAAKRGGNRLRVAFDPDAAAPSPKSVADVIDLVEALEGLEKHDSRKAEVVKLRVFWGLTVPEVAETLGVARTTIERDWQFARAWLAKKLSE